MSRGALALLLACLAAPVTAQTISTSPAPDGVSVTIYRAPHRSAGEAMELDWLNGYALISERRQVAIPAGEADIRFEGVAGGIIPESAIVTGLPSGVVEKNQDAYLLSPASLLDRSLGRRVHLRRTSKATGEVREHEAVIRSSADGAVVLQTEEGFEALRCSGLRETLVYERIPEGLSAKPTLSVRTRSDRAATATVTLSYLATGFDWQANYIASLSPSGDRMDLFAWVTLANGDETSFRNADTQTVAGRLNKEDDDRRDPPKGKPLSLRCWPAGRTSDIPLTTPPVPPPPPAPPPPPEVYYSPMAVVSVDEENIVVTGGRIARREELGDLKLYRVPEPVTVAANSQKQVALLDQPGVKVSTVYRQRIYPGSNDEGPARRVIVSRNRTAEGLGLPLPAGKVAFFAEGRERPILLGEGTMEDLAVDEDVELVVGEATGVQTVARNLPGQQRDRMEYEYVVTSDYPYPITFELEIAGSDGPVAADARLGRRDGRPLWVVTVPANGSRTLRYRVGAADED